MAAAVVSVVTVVTSGCGGPPDLETSRNFQQAEQAFSAAKTPEDFLRVAGLYQEILDRGFVSGTVLFNQGNALMRAGQRGRAIAAYRQAQRWRPRDPYLDANLQNALESTAADGPRSSPMDYVLFWQDWLSYREKFLLTTITLGLALLLGIAGRLSPQPRLWKRLGLACLALTLLSGTSTARDVYRYDLVRHGVVVQSETIARKGNSQTYEPAFTSALRDGTEFEVRERRGDWLRIHVAKAGEGWIPAQAATTY